MRRGDHDWQLGFVPPFPAAKARLASVRLPATLAPKREQAFRAVPASRRPDETRDMSGQRSHDRGTPEGAAYKSGGDRPGFRRLCRRLKAGQLAPNASAAAARWRLCCHQLRR